MLIVLLGPNGCGKTAIEKALEKRGIKRLRSHTTRRKRPGESDDAYYFVGMDIFKKLKMAESVLFNNAFYGLSVEEIRKAETGNFVTTLEWRGIEQIQRLFPQAVTVYLHCPQYQLEKRLPKLNSYQEEEKRMAKIEADSKIAMYCDHIVDNSDGRMAEAVEEIISMYK